MLIVVTGSRDWKDGQLIERVLRHYNDSAPALEEITLVHGGARGADFFAKVAATRLGWNVIECQADWDTHGKSAGSIRNNQMLDRQPDLVLAFWDGQSRGTEHCMNEARERGIHTRVFEENNIYGN